MNHVCDLPRWRRHHRRFRCPECGAHWVVVRYIRWRVWMTVKPDGKVDRRL